MRLGKRYGNERVERACGKAMTLNIVGYRHIQNLLKNERETLPLARIIHEPFFAWIS